MRRYATRRQHHLGIDLNGNAGGDFFTNISDGADATAVVRANSANTGSATISASIVDVSQLTVSDYQLDYDGANYSVTRLSDGNVVYGPTALGALPATIDVEGFRLTVTAAPNATDNFLSQPTSLAARSFSMNIQRIEEIAVAAPIRTANGFNNIGSGDISPGLANSPDNLVTITFTGAALYDVVDETTGATLASNQAYVPGNISYNGWTAAITGAPVAGDTFTVDKTVTSSTSATANIGIATVSEPDPNIDDSVTITFNNPPTTFDVAGATTGTPTVNVPYTSGVPISFNGWTVNLIGNPEAGDTFTVEQNTNGIGDNRNALLMATLQTSLTLENGRASYQDAYTQMVADVGTEARQAEINRNAQEALMDQTIGARESVSGVNLDEEAADLMRFQQAYQASAQVISTADSIFQELINALRR